MPEELGEADFIGVQEVSGRQVTVVRVGEEDNAGVATIVLRGATPSFLEDVERAVNDAVAVAKHLCRDGRMLAGAGAIELEVAHQLGAAHFPPRARVLPPARGG